MMEVKPIVYQPGTGTRYDIVIGVITSAKDAATLCTDVGNVFVAWKGKGAWNFSPEVGVHYIMEKLKLEPYEYDAEAIKQLVKCFAGRPTSEGWPICEDCGLPFHKKKPESECMCVKFP